MNPIQRFFQEDIPATFSSGKWRINLLQLNTRLGQLEKQQKALLNELGAKAWESRLKDLRYADIYGRLEELDGLVGQVQQEIDLLQGNINQETNRLNGAMLDFDARLKGAQAQRQEAFQKLTQLQTRQRDIEQRIGQMQMTINQGTTNIQSLNAQITQLQASALVDKDARIESFKSTIDAIQSQISTIIPQVNSATAELGTVQADQRPIKGDMDRIDQFINMIQEQNRSATGTIQEQIKNLQQNLLKVNEKKSKLLGQISAQLPELGAQVYRYRPAAEVLSPIYAKVDALQNAIRDLNNEINLTKARLASVNSQSLLKVVFAGGAVIFLIVAAIVLFVWVAPAVATLLKPDPKASIRLAQSWTLENCDASRTSEGTYVDIAVWENRRTDAIASVETETKLFGAKEVVLDSNSSSMEIAPGGQSVSMVILQANGSRVQEINRSVSSVYFNKTTLVRPDNIVTKPVFTKSQNSNNVVISLEITNKSDFGIASGGSSSAFAFVVNKQNKLIDILAGGLQDRSVAMDAMSKVEFYSINSSASSCLQSDYSTEEVTFWYFVPLQIPTDSGNQFSISGKAVYTP